MSLEARRRRLEPDARREQILSCAVRLFGEHPYEEVSAGDIAQAAGVARGLVNHYFGTKKDLYLEVVRTLVTIPDVVLNAVPDGDLQTRVDGAVTWFLDTVSRHAKPWLAAIGAGGPSRNPDVAAVIAQADEVTVDHILRLANGGLASSDPELRAATRAYVSFARSGSVEWLVRGSLTRGQVHTLLSRTLVTLLDETIPAVQRAGSPAARVVSSPGSPRPRSET
jgi:AcrR family transcriptional regulator